MRVPSWSLALALLGLTVPAAAEVQQVTIAAGGVL
jgi:hypothetical protein